MENTAISKQELDLLFIIANADHETASRQNKKAPKKSASKPVSRATAPKNNSFRSLTRAEFIGALVRLCQALNPLNYRRAPAKTLSVFLREVSNEGASGHCLRCVVLNVLVLYM